MPTSTRLVTSEKLNKGKLKTRTIELKRKMKMLENRSLPVIVLLVLLALPASAQSKLDVVTTLPDLQNIVESIGGERVEASSIATGYQNPHFVDPKPSHIRKLSRADMFVTVGLDLTTGWVPPLLTSSRNSSIQPGGSGYIDASVNVPLLQVPSSVSREQGDIHVFGNPHYWLDPAIGHVIAHNIFDGLVRIQPESEDYFRANLEAFDTALDAKIVEWQEMMAPFAGTDIIAYHNQWPYFETAFDLRIAEFLEPKPGIPPTPSQLAKVIDMMEGQNIDVIIISPYFKADSAELVVRSAGGQVVTLATSVAAFDEIVTYFDLFDYNVNALVNAFSAKAGD